MDGVFMATASPKKPAKGKAQTASADPRLASKDIWLAGLGAMAQAQAQAQEHFTQLAQGLGTSMGQPVGIKVDRLEHLFEDRVARALKSLGLPTAQEVAALQERVAALEAALLKSSPKAAVKTSRPAK
jgi:hypothetical protein